MSGLNFACQLTSIVGGYKSHDLQASTCFSQGSKSGCVNLPSKLCSEAQLEYNKCHVHCDLEEQGNHLEQVPYEHCAIWRAQLLSFVL